MEDNTAAPALTEPVVALAACLDDLDDDSGIRNPGSCAFKAGRAMASRSNDSDIFFMMVVNEF